MTDKEIKVGDIVRYTGESKDDLTRGNAYKVCEVHDSWFYVDGDFGEYALIFCDDYELVTDDTPTLWRDMTDAEKGALLLAHHKGKALQMLIGDEWFDRNGIFADNVAYRIKPEPKKPREVWLMIEGEHITDATFDGTDASKHGYVRAVLDD